MMEKYYLRYEGDLVDVELMGVFQTSRVIDPSPFIGGHNGGVVSNPIAVVKRYVNGVGKFMEVSLKDLEFKKVDEVIFDGLSMFEVSDGVISIQSDGWLSVGDTVKFRDILDNEHVDTVKEIVRRKGLRNQYRFMNTPGLYSRDQITKLEVF